MSLAEGSGARAPRRAPNRARVYELYGLRVRSAIPLPFPSLAGRGRATVTVRRRSAAFFARLRRRLGLGRHDGPWFRRARLPDGGEYLRWTGLFEFRVSADGCEITARSLNGASGEGFQTYLLGQVLSFALVKRGVEPLHSTAAVVDGGAVAFLGDCGYGKSTLGAAFLRAGSPVLTDDLLVLEERPEGFIAHSGPPRIKLFPKVADRLLGGAAGGRAMTHLTPKLVIPLEPPRACSRPVPLKAVYVLRPSARSRRRGRVSIRRLSPRRACMELIKNTFNPVVVEPERLARQLHLAARVASRVPVMTLAYPRGLARLSEVVAAVRRRAE